MQTYVRKKILILVNATRRYSKYMHARRPGSIIEYELKMNHNYQAGNPRQTPWREIPIPLFSTISADEEK